MTPEADFAGSSRRGLANWDNQAKTVTLVVQRTLTATRWQPDRLPRPPTAVRLLAAVQTFASVERSTPRDSQSPG